MFKLQHVSRVCRFFLLMLVALALAGSVRLATVDAAAPRFLVCQLPDGSNLLIVIENFGGMGGAANHCVHFWNGRPRGVE